MLSYKTPATLVREGEIGRAHLASFEAPVEFTASAEFIAAAIEKNAHERAKRTPSETPTQFLRRVGYIRD